MGGLASLLKIGGVEYPSRPVTLAAMSKPRGLSGATRYRPFKSRFVQVRSLTEIARALFGGVKTVSTHGARILQELGLRNDAEPVRYALRHGLAP